MIKNKKIKILTISILCILTITIGLSYGYYLLNKVQENNNIAGSQCFNLEFTNEKNAISLDNMYHISDEEGRKLTPYSFTITNTCDMLAGYTVNMEMLEGTTLNSKYLDVMVNNEQIKLLTNYESTNTVITGSTESRILAKGTLAYNDSIDYTVRFWMDKNVEDTESMNKIFKSKIVISATPSSWNPKEAGYDTLHNAILANEYQTTPEDAISKIEAKGTPDFSQTAPIITWVPSKGNIMTRKIEKINEEVINDSALNTIGLTKESSLLLVGRNYSFDNKTGKYTLTDTIYADPTKLDYNDDYYFCGAGVSYNSITNSISTYDSNSCISLLKITSASKKSQGVAGTLNYRILYNLSGDSLLQLENENDKSDKGLYQTIDDYGVTYYYRGNIKNNNVYFAGFYWQIIRLNGDSSIRMIYNGTEKNARGSSKNINTIAFNQNKNKPAYSGYMYGKNFDTYENSIKNELDSNIKNVLDVWYKENLNSYDEYINDSGFCNDRSLFEGDGKSLTINSKYSSLKRFYDNLISLKCSNLANDLFTLKNNSIGNKSLIYPIGLVTYDELMAGGLNNKYLNKMSYLYSDSNYWTMTPTQYVASAMYTALWASLTEGYINFYYSPNEVLGVRPVINLKSDVKITGGLGTSNDPYVIDTSK